MITIEQFIRVIDIALTAPLFLEQREWLLAIKATMVKEQEQMVERQKQESNAPPPQE